MKVVHHNVWNEQKNAKDVQHQEINDTQKITNSVQEGYVQIRNTQVKHIPTVLNEEGYNFYKSHKNNNIELNEYIEHEVLPLSIEKYQIKPQDFWNLLLSKCIDKADYEEVKDILNKHYYHGLLTDTDRFNQSPIVHLMNSRDQESESIIADFIKNNNSKITPVRLTNDHFNHMKFGINTPDDIGYHEERIENIIKPLFDSKDVMLFGEIYNNFNIQNPD